MFHLYVYKSLNAQEVKFCSNKHGATKHMKILLLFSSMESSHTKVGTLQDQVKQRYKHGYETCKWLTNIRENRSLHMWPWDCWKAGAVAQTPRWFCSPDDLVPSQLNSLQSTGQTSAVDAQCAGERPPDSPIDLRRYNKRDYLTSDFLCS